MTDCDKARRQSSKMIRDMAKEITRLSGECTGLWEKRRLLLRNMDAAIEVLRYAIEHDIEEIRPTAQAVVDSWDEKRSDYVCSPEEEDQ